MKYAIFTLDGLGFTVAKHLQDEGHEVIVGRVTDDRAVFTEQELGSYVKESSFWKKRRFSVYKNIVKAIPAEALVERLKNVSHPEEYFVFFDGNYLFTFADALKHLPLKGHFPTLEDRIFEVDRNVANEFVKKHYPKIKITEKKKFFHADDAKAFLVNTTKVWVLKGADKESTTYVPTSNDVAVGRSQVLDVLYTFQKDYEKSGFFLEEKINSIIEITPEKIYYDGVPLALNINIENKHIGSSNISYQVGCAGDLVFPISMKNKIHDIAFPPIVDELAKQHKGLFFWDASLLIDAETDSIYFGEFCPNRPWYNSFFTYLGQMPSVNHFFENVVAKKNPFTLGTVGASLMIFNILHDPETNEMIKDLSVFSPEKPNYHVWPYDIYKKTKKDITRIVGYNTHVSPITGFGKSVTEAVDAVYKNLESFSFPEAYYRPKSDFLSVDYSTSILNRLRYGVKKGLYELPFSI